MFRVLLHHRLAVQLWARFSHCLWCPSLVWHPEVCGKHFGFLHSVRRVLNGIQSACRAGSYPNQHAGSAAAVGWLIENAKTEAYLGASVPMGDRCGRSEGGCGIQGTFSGCAVNCRSSCPHSAVAAVFTLPQNWCPELMPLNHDTVLRRGANLPYSSDALLRLQDIAVYSETTVWVSSWRYMPRPLLPSNWAGVPFKMQPEEESP